MALDEFDEEEEYETPSKRKKKIKIPRGVKIGILVLIVGIILGVALGHYVVEPIIGEGQSNICSECLATKEILSLENTCLYTYIDDVQIVVDGCSTWFIAFF